MSKRGRGGSAGAKFRISLGLPVGAVINCADNTGKYVKKNNRGKKKHMCVILNLNLTRTCSCT
ncbi:60S ribosomal protein L23 [Pogonomyrmex barbatus]|uniref:60S ribosomal protein L23 n=1 Tax=Pogonomyrmex barbatus TaxID=144034 RepID=A0A6I9W4X0_9HYME|nr:60S ribosomal protein L23 [Pogonomyrmex barbatus]